MQKSKTREYLKTQIKTASKEQLLVMLYDGAIRFCEQAKMSFEEKDLESFGNYLVRVQKIIMELMTALSPDVDPEFASKMMGLYQYVNTRLIEANIEQDLNKIDECLSIVRPLRDAWSDAVTKLRKQGQLPQGPPVRAGLSIQG